MTHRPNVVFVCLHGAAKSVVGAELFKRYAADRGFAVEVAARGLQPDAEVSTAAAQGLSAEGIDLCGSRPVLLTRQEVAGATRVVAFGCDVSGIVPPTIPVEQWAEVPAVSDGYAAARAAVAAHLPRLLEDCRR